MSALEPTADILGRGKKRPLIAISGPEVVDNFLFRIAQRPEVFVEFERPAKLLLLLFETVLRYPQGRPMNIATGSGLATVLVFIAGCTAQPERIGASDVSPARYRDLECGQVYIEMNSVNRRAAELEKSLDSEARADTGQMAEGVIPFWPAWAFLEGGRGPEAAAYAQLNGQRKTLEEVSSQKGCYGLDLYGPLSEDTSNGGEGEWHEY
ncbi:MAG: hypothetical protein O7G83_13555 [Proteobacteria bacterium]|nr:hypothetical protein [Pseudomonadota bacterium]